MKTRHMVIPAVFLILEKEDKILLIKRLNTGHEDGNYGLPSGHLNGDETIAQALVREAKEEVGIEVNAKDLRLVHVISHKGTDAERVDFFFTVLSWKGEPENCEPEKCSEIAWFDKNNLPRNTIMYTKQALQNIEKGNYYSEYNW